MKVFHLTLEFDLKEKPFWLDDFRKKYDDPYNFHITLKYPTFIKDADLSNLKNDVQQLANESETFEVVFNKYFFNKTKTGNLIMVLAQHNKSLTKLQQKVVDKLTKYGKTRKLYYEVFESNFKPHISIARKLADKTYLQAQKQLKSPIYCKATITKLALTIVNKGYTVGDVVNPQNALYYSLSSGS